MKLLGCLHSATTCCASSVAPLPPSAQCLAITTLQPSLSTRSISIDPDIRIFNKYGDSYGYIIDNSYFVDLKNKVEFMLTAVVQSNEDEIYNDNNYEYDTVCYPFMKNLGRVIYADELKREKKFQPDLLKFRFKY